MLDILVPLCPSAAQSVSAPASSAAPQTRGARGNDKSDSPCDVSPSSCCTCCTISATPATRTHWTPVVSSYISCRPSSYNIASPEVPDDLGTCLACLFPPTTTWPTSMWLRVCSSGPSTSRTTAHALSARAPTAPHRVPFCATSASTRLPRSNRAPRPGRRALCSRTGTCPVRRPSRPPTMVRTPSTTMTT
jgi:hypothetical protein